MSLKIKNADATNRFLAAIGLGSTDADPFFSIPADFYLEIRKANVPKHSLVNIFGHKDALGTAEVVLAELPAADDIDQSAIDATPATVKVSSSDADDTSAGAGLRTLTLSGLDSSGDAQSETITMNGQTGVTSANTYSAILGLKGLTWGATTWNEGIVYVGTGTITAGKPAVILTAIGFDATRARGDNKALSAYYVVPNAKTFYGVHLTGKVGTSNKDVQIHIQVSSDGVNWITEEVFEFESGSNIVKPINALPAQVAGTHIRITGVSSAAGTNVSGVLDGVLIDD